MMLINKEQEFRELEYGVRIVSKSTNKCHANVFPDSHINVTRFTNVNAVHLFTD